MATSLALDIFAGPGLNPYTCTVTGSPPPPCAGCADQAIDLGHIPTAVRLAEACEQRGRKLTNPKALAYYRNTYARATAADGDHTTAVKLLTSAQAAIEHAPALPGRQPWSLRGWFILRPVR